MSKQSDLVNITQGTLDVDGGTIKLDGNYPVGTNNVALGDAALDSLSTGTRNTAIGFSAGTALTTQSYNVFVGSYSGDGATGSSNVAVGDVTLRATSGNNNVAVGNEALISNANANFNTAVGSLAGYTNTTGTNNCLIGYRAGYLQTTGNYNTFVGPSGAGYYVTTGSKNTILGNYNGNQNGLDIRTSSNNIVLSDGDGKPYGYFDPSGGLHVGVAGSGSSQFSSYYTDDGLLQAWDTTGEYMLHLHCGRNGVQYFCEFEKNGSTIGHIRGSDTSVSYSTTSDHRLKENVVELTSATDRLKQLNPSRFNFIAEPDRTVDGFLAHEVQTVVPEAVTGTHNEVDADGNPVYQGIDQSKLVPLLVATIKELEARITALEAN